MNNIAIIGATGMLGKPVAKAFIAAGFTVTLLARDAAKASAVFGPSVRVVRGDLRDEASVRTLLQGQDAVYLNLSVEQTSTAGDWQAEREGLALVLRVAKELGIQRVGYLSSLLKDYDGFPWWVFDIKRAAVDAVRKSGIPYSVFFPSTFMEAFDSDSPGSMRQGQRLTLSGLSRHKMYLIAGDDYGRQVVRAFALDNGDNDYAVQGKEGFTTDEAAALFAQHYTAAKLSVSAIPMGVLRFFALFSRRFDYVAHIVHALNEYPETFQAETTWKELGEPRLTLLEYIRSKK
ncbi:MAG: SDR family oxidoreductase [Candidatus Kapaibacterium sp.]